MSLSPGARLGPYEVLEAIGAGGMGEVYRARDTKLKRDVALKILPEAFAADGDRLARFEREAQALAALNHPNIAQIYGFDGDLGRTEPPATAGPGPGGPRPVPPAGGSLALVMELVEGEDLTARVAKGALPIDEALPIARQIALALEAAHEAGIIHRDLKPANIKVRTDGTVKVLDFGLAKALAGPDGTGSTNASAIANSPTLTARATELGVILGTAAYMAPEQAKGRAVDRRADVWAFGVVLYEMLTGRRAFGGEDVTEVMAAVIRDTPDLDALPAGTPPAVLRLLRRCLEKDPRKRLRDMGDAGVELDEAMSGKGDDRAPAAAEAAVGSSARSPIALVAGAVLVASLAGLAAWWMKPAPVVERPITRFAVLLAEGQDLQNLAMQSIALSPDGRRLAYRSQGSIFIRNFGEVETRELVASQGVGVWFSPDGEMVLYGTTTGLSRMPVAGGTAQQIAASVQLFGADWGDDGTIVFSDSRSIKRVPDVGGEPETLVEASAPGDGVVWPQLLPDGRSLLYTNFGAGGRSTVVKPLAGGAARTVLSGFGGVRYVSSGHLIYGLDNHLFAVPFDLDRGEVAGTAVPLPEAVYVSTQSSWAQASVSRTGVLAHVMSDTPQENLQLVWASADGTTSPALTVPRVYTDISLSPDGRRAAMHLWDEENDVWVADLVRGGLTRITFTPAEEETPVWSPDGRELAYAASRDATRRSLFVKPADGSAAAVEREVWSDAGHFHVNDWSADGRTIIIEARRAATLNDLVAIDIETGAATDLLSSPYSEMQARLSPDGKWLAYVSDESSRKEVYVQPYPALDARVLVSIEGGVEPVWSADGRRLFFRSEDIMMSAMTSTSPLEFGPPERLFPDRFGRTQGEAHTHYDVAADGRFLMIDSPIRGGPQQRQEINIVLNWGEQLKRLAPVK